MTREEALQAVEVIRITLENHNASIAGLATLYQRTTQSIETLKANQDVLVEMLNDISARLSLVERNSDYPSSQELDEEFEKTFNKEFSKYMDAPGGFKWNK